MYYALGTVHQLLVRGAVIMAAMIEVMAFWRRIAKAVVTLLVGAVIVGPLSPSAGDDSSAGLPRGDTR